MRIPEEPLRSDMVAPRMGSVDRNLISVACGAGLKWSLPAWGAWIEIQKSLACATEGLRRSPHGERG